jgi:hypothetical protein
MYNRTCAMISLSLFIGGLCLAGQGQNLSADKVAPRLRTRAQTRLVANESDKQARKQARRAALAGPASQPAGASAAGNARDKADRQPFFRSIDRDRDGKLQAQEIARFAEVFKKAEEAAQKTDLTPEDWAKFVDQLRGDRGLRGKKAIGKRAAARQAS